MKMPKNVDLSKSINREKVIEPSIANNEKNIECPPLRLDTRYRIIFTKRQESEAKKLSYNKEMSSINKYSNLSCMIL